jgi:hypothetical protein
LLRFRRCFLQQLLCINARRFLALLAAPPNK